MSLSVPSLVRVRRHANPRVPVYVRRQAHRRAIVEMVARHLPPLQAKIRRRMLDDLAGRIVAREGEIDLFFELDETTRLAATALHARHVVPVLEEEHAALVTQFRRLTRMHEELGSELERRRLLAEHLAQPTVSRWRLRADRAALRRHLDLTVLKERHDGERHRVLVSIELALDFIAGALQAVADDAGSRPPEARALVERSDLPGFLVGCLLRSSRWQTRRAAVRALEAAVRAGCELARPAVESLREHLQVPHEHPWVQAAIVDVLWRVEPALAMAVTEQRLLQPGPHGLDFLVRRLLLDRVDRRSAWAVELLPRVLAAGEPTEHVRIGIALVAARLLPQHPAALDVLAHLGPTAPAEGSPEPRPGDPSPRVRAHAVRALLDALGPRLPEADAAPLVERAVELLRTWLAHEHEALPLLVACEDLRRLLEQHERAFEPLEALVPSLITLSCDDARPVAVHEDAAATLETLDRVRSGPRRNLVQRLRAALEDTRVPGRCRVVVPHDAGDRTEVGRALAELTREDWGVFGSLTRRTLRLHRGERFTAKLWRVLHELRHRAPNKRQGFRHTIGRVFTGTLRAHSGRLEEVTPTVVPGERVHIRGEGGWGRHVPTVDDASSLPVLRSEPVELYSSFGVTRLRATGSLPGRLWARLRLALRYADVAAQRTRSLDSAEPEERRRYLTMLRDRYGVDVSIEPPPPTAEHPRRLPARVTSLLPVPRAPARSDAPPERPHAALALAPGGLVSSALPRLEEWLDTYAHYFLSMQANEQSSLAAFFVGAFAVFFGESHRRRRAIDRARASIPLCIGGWGTRGKSGTERIKAGLFHGLGYQVFSKTTGCEAMMIHSIPEGPSSEIFVFRPYGKATIWEQRNLLELGAALRADVFLWECMALNPKYVEVLQHKWMRDDLTTLTNAYPDHEDIQGPAGINVAETIACFIPLAGTMITSEINFLPLFREVSRRRRTRMIALGNRDGELIARELLDLFPYQEHPRNIALVATMAEHLGLERDLAIVTMAQHVVPDLGVLKSYPKVRVRGRVLEFINGCSANERAGFMANWDRTGCAALAGSDDPEQLVITVVNNRDDRISRSEVFARILVSDTVVDRHVLIGTNLRGLVAFVRGSLGVYLQSLQIVRPDDREQADGRARAVGRLAALMRRLRISAPEPDPLLLRLHTYAVGAGLQVRDPAPVRAVCERVLAHDGATELPKVQRELEEDRALQAALDGALHEHAPAASPAPPEVLGPCTRKELVAHFVRQLARSVIHARLQRQLEQALASRRSDDIDAFEARVREAYRVLFEDMLIVVEDPKTKGDAIIQACARCVPPGTHVRIMGTQNIKGTGLDFVYRWLAIDAVQAELRAHAEAPGAEGRIAALERLEAFADHGVADLGLLLAFLRTHEPGSPAERAVLDRLRGKVEPAHAKRKAALDVDTGSSAPAGQKKAGWKETAVGWVEGWLDFLDGARRFHESAGIMRDLVNARIAHPKAAVLMRDIYTREKGGWLYKRLFQKA